MKPNLFLATAAALVAVAGCNSNEGNAATGGTSSIKVAPPKNGDWSTVVTATPAGGMLMGNPQAKVQLIEYGSLTCPHCREFDEAGAAPLIANYVKTGKVGYEFRNYVRDPFDLTATLVARCNGPKTFFPLTRAFYKDQPKWIAKVQQAPREQLEALQALPPAKQFVELAKLAGFPQYAAVRGVSAAKLNQCLADENAINQLVEMTGQATSEFPNFPGTPTFIINGQLVEKTATWDKLEPALKAALGK